MKFLQLPLLCTLIVSLVLTPVAAQQKHRNADKVPAKSPATPAPAPPTFENLIAADSFKVYVEVRGVGQLARSTAANDVLEPVLKLGGPAKEFVDFIEWLKSHADQLTTSRMLIAAWPNLKDAPELVAAIEFSSAEEAAKFEKPLDGLLPAMFPPRPQSSPEAEKKSAAQQQPPATQQPAASEQKPAPEQEAAAPVPGYALQRAGSLLIVSPAPLQLKKLRPPGSKPLSEDANFRVAYNRFASDPIFLFIDFKALEKEREEQRKQWEEENKRTAEAAQKRKEEENAGISPDTNTSSEYQINEKVVNPADRPADAPTEETKETKESSQAQLASVALSSVTSALFASSVPQMPDALGLGFSPDNDSFDFRALMIDGAGKTSDPVPLFPWVKFGGPIAPQSPAVIPADSELVLTMSLDFQQLYARISAPTAPFVLISAGENTATEPTVPRRRWSNC